MVKGHLPVKGPNSNRMPFEFLWNMTSEFLRTNSSTPGEFLLTEPSSVVAASSTRDRGSVGDFVLFDDSSTFASSGDDFQTTPDQNSTDSLFDVSPGLVTLLSILYGSISVITIIGNAFIILVIVKNRSMHTVTNFFIANLSVADVTVGFFSIPFQFQAALLQRWDLPTILCPVAPFVKELSLNVSIIALVVISIDRYFAVLHPLKPRFSRRCAKIVMAIVWAFSITSSAPCVIVFRVIWIEEDHGLGTKPFCYPDYPKLFGTDLGYIYRIFLVLIQYFIPLMMISYAYARIIHKIWLSKAPGSAVDSRDQAMNRNKRKVIKMLIIVVGLFAFCWLPIQTYNLLSEIHPQINLYRYINIIWFCSNWLAMSNSCYNPFIYGLLNEKFKQGFRRLFRRCLGPMAFRRQSTAIDRFSDGDFTVKDRIAGGSSVGGPRHHGGKSPSMFDTLQVEDDPSSPSRYRRLGARSTTPISNLDVNSIAACRKKSDSSGF